MILIYLNFSFMFFFCSVLSLLLMMKMLILKLKLFIEVNLVLFNSMNISLMVYLDYKSFMFISVVSLISSMIILYSIEYMSEDIYSIRFIFLLILFVISMIFMIIGQNLLMILLGWDGLGLISYCLVIYYNNWNSYNSGMLTILTNRLGDIGLLVSIGLYSSEGDWNFLILNNLSSDYLLLLFLLMIILAGVTKSAQIPFSSWLPMAMAAPTPISALVHSSTLVTAGVYLFIRLNMCKFKSVALGMVFISLITMFFSGMVASFENDLKKIIALSTLSQLGLMMLSLFLGFKLLSFFHLIIHAMFKSLLFMCAGLILHSMVNNQDIRGLGVMNFNYIYTLMLFNTSNLALCGFPFMSGFYSKDLILELSIFYNLNMFILLLFYMSIMMTVIYSFRLMFYMMSNYMKFFSYFSCNDNKIMNLSMMFMFIYSVVGGVLFSWVVFNSLNIFCLEFKFKLYLDFLLILSMFIGIFMNFMLFNLKFMMKIILFMKSLWMMNYFSNLYIKNVLFFGGYLFLFLEKGWIEMFGFKLVYYFYLNMMSFEKLALNLLLMMLMIFFWLLLMIFI